VAIVGHGFMGRVHSNAWISAPLFFELPAVPVLKAACGRSREATESFARRWGWQESASDWRSVVERPDIDVVDIAAPHHLHHDIAVAAAAEGKHVFCEKPLALDAPQAREMYRAVRRAGVVHYVNFNYRRCPAVALARRLIDEGRIGRIFHWRGAYLRSPMVDPQVPLGWHMRKETAGSGAQASLNSHSIDLARYLVGEIRAVAALDAIFITERPLPGAGADPGAGPTGEVDTEDAAFMVAELQGGALGSFEATRFATGRKNAHTFEIYGSRGALSFDLERMNELRYYSRDEDAESQGFRTVVATDPNHAYAGAWWPPGHGIGYEHTFVHAVADFVRALFGGRAIGPDFHDGLRCMQVIDAALESAASGRKVVISEE
jgi:predicted dehydrogenase